LALGVRTAALKEEMQVGLNAYALYKGFNDAICYISEGRY
jgi:molybdopterin-containing oxidoreductase family iron-sulfur binding subunit